MSNSSISLIIALVLSFLSGLGQPPQPSPFPLQRGADSLFFNQKYSMALEKYKAFLASNANAPLQVYARIAFCNHYIGNYTEAKRMYDTVLKKQPPSPLKPQLYSRMAMTYAMTNDKEKAFIYLDSATSNGYFNAFEMENFKDYENIRKDPRFKRIYDRVSNNAYPCMTRPEARQFDFWIGDWEVYNNLYPNHRVGTSKIESISGGCSILENWEAFQTANSGKSQKLV